ncbi:1008_t:CDS:2, partial [Cetraspora pellucida]
LLNKICEIASSPARDMSNIKDLLEDEELVNRLVFQVEQGGYYKYSVVDNISEVYSLSEIHEYNGWDELNYAKVQPPNSAEFEVKPHILSAKKINNQKKIIVGQDSLKKYVNQVLQKYSDYLRS